MLVAHFGARDVLLTDGGTGALTLAIKSCLADRPGAAVALPAYGCYDLATAADGADAPVVLYDLVPETLAPDMDSLRRALDHPVGAVVLVHLYGIPVDPDPVRAAMAKSGAWLIEDAAQGGGASLGGRPLGSFGDLAVLSFGRGKGITAGRGGALLAQGDAAASLLGRARGELLPPLRGVKELVQLKAQWLLARAGHGLTSVRAPLRAEAGYLRLPFVASPAARAAASWPESRATGVMHGYPTPLSNLGGFGDRVRNLPEGFPGARMLAQRLVTLPVHGLLSKPDLAALEAWARVPQ